MWRSSKRLVVNCIQFMVRCGRNNNLDVDDLDDISEYDLQDVPVHFQPQTFALPVEPPRQEEFQHRPDAPGIRRSSPPEIVMKMRQALEEMSQIRGQPIAAKARGDHSVSFESSLYPETSSMGEV